MSKINLEYEEDCEKHLVSYKKRFLFCAWGRKTKCELCDLRVQGKEPYSSFFQTIIITMMFYLSIIFWSYFGLWVSILLTFILYQLSMAAVAVLIPLATERHVKKLK